MNHNQFLVIVTMFFLTGLAATIVFNHHAPEYAPERSPLPPVKP